MLNHFAINLCPIIEFCKAKNGSNDKRVDAGFATYAKNISDFLSCFQYPSLELKEKRKRKKQDIWETRNQSLYLTKKK